jgi:hypothetical protein
MIAIPDLPPMHRAYLDRLIAVLDQDPRFTALLGAGSLIHGGFDDHSDLDCVLVVEAAHYAEVMAARMAFAESIGPLIAAFTGEHVGEPRLLICLYGPPLLHVDLKCVTADDLDRMVERPVILWARAPDAIARRLDAAAIAWPDQPPEWFEARVWVWLHYGATKLQRGELFEAIAMLGFLREQVLGPMLHRRAGRPQRGVRRLEQRDVGATAALKATLAGHDAAEIAAALRAAAALYVELRADQMPSETAPGMPGAVMAMLAAF